MDKGIYTALSGGIAKSHELELIANNLANANTPGFKRDTGTFNEYLTELRRADNVEGVRHEILAATSPDARVQGDKSFVEMDGVYTDFRQGNLDETHRALDLGLQGDGFFEVLTPAGVRYTRQGNFSIDAQGRLVTGSGFPVLSRLGAPVPGNESTVPPELRVIQLGNAPVSVTNDGAVVQEGKEVAALSVQEFHEPQWLEKTGNSYYRNTDPANLKPGEVRTQVHQGFLEGSNVNAVKEMTRLIEATRAYESHMQAIKTYQEIDGRTVNDIARDR
jgi:flagellar basal-body rod protein FlgG